MIRSYRYLMVPILLLLCAASRSQKGADESSPPDTAFYVSPVGDDSNPGTSKAPWRTIQHAADIATPGSTVLVHGGIYAERVTINVSGSAAKGYITFRSHPGETAVLDGESLSVPDGRSAMVSVQDKSYIRIQGFEIRNYRSSERRCAPAGIFVRGAGSNIEILNNNVHHIEQNYQQKGANAFGIAVYGTSAQSPISRLIIDGNEVHHLKTGSSESVVVNGNVTDFRIDHNVIHDNNNILFAGPQGLLTVSKSGPMAGNQPTVVMDYNIYFSPPGPEASQLQFDNASHTGFDNYVKATGNDRHSRFADPRFVNLSAHDFHLQKDSPAVNAGVNLGARLLGTQDLDKGARIRGAEIDIGCYQRP